MTKSKFYHSIAPFYDHIFPLQQPALNFTRELVTANSVVLDAGCATGNMAIALEASCRHIDAFDLDGEMIEQAKAKSRSRSNSFFVGDMLKMEKQFGTNQYDLIICYGNTLVHLQSIGDILSFLTQAYNLLNSNAGLAIQILNYNYILDEEIDELPLIENDYVRFRRKYAFRKNSRLVDFDTELTVKQSGQKIQNTTPLFALRPEELRELLHKAGFKYVEMYSSYNKAAFSNSQMPLVLHAKKA
ncbi:Glycine/sarcosine N-methyltransferase [Salinivirga cyanobacteriivorans]|uniref:Glycine/sarcosine N-methyltransferase n=1 Tax=Salinivirga cyanobacteriivorans TaxID=1307839 RepID=A0A0S2HYV6_9BACT|nr:class I SAM-dependent methyltransferase [Salinivirga cyanobacteriivorans]ALO15174.1 Glycine/sarcosine N-methyltransferase [Salinivirga cyanobacteriivorans]